MATEFTINGEQFQIGRMDVFTQADIAAKIAPLLVPFAQMAKEDGLLEKDGGEDRKKMVDALFGNLERLTAAFAKIPNEDRRFVMESCFKAVSYKPPGGVGWVPIWNGHALQYEHLDTLPMAVQICGNVISDKLKSFF